MGYVDAFWHLVNFVAPACCVALLSALGCRLLWRDAVRARRWWPTVMLGACSGVLVLGLGLAVSGQDGRMLTYMAMCLAVALSQWWWLFVRRR